MKMKKLWRSRKALSPVIAAIILIAVTVAVSIAVAAWMGALTFTFMGYEELEITGVKWTWQATGRYCKFNVTNSGTRDVTVSSVKLNYVAKTVSGVPFPLTTGSVEELQLTFDYTNGTAYDISVVTSSGYAFTDHFTGGQDAS